MCRKCYVAIQFYGKVQSRLLHPDKTLNLKKLYFPYNATGSHNAFLALKY